MALGEIQNIFFSWSRFCAKMIPAVIAAGSAGGTHTVIMSKA